MKVREYSHDEIIDIKWVPTLDNVSDLFTKPLDKIAFLRHRDTIMPPMQKMAAHVSLHEEAVQLGAKANSALRRGRLYLLPDVGLAHPRHHQPIVLVVCGQGFDYLCLPQPPRR